MDGSPPTQATRQQKHYEFGESLQHLKMSIDRIEDLYNTICGAEVPRDTKEPSGTNHSSLATFLNEGATFVMSQTDRLEKLRSALQEALF